jgi:polyhydroxybutyrate depolymerase
MGYPFLGQPIVAYSTVQFLGSTSTYGGGKDGAEVVLVIIEGAGHTWPGQQPAVKFLGKSTRNVSANEMMWEFFQKHPMK